MLDGSNVMTPVATTHPHPLNNTVRFVAIDFRWHTDCRNLILILAIVVVDNVDNIDTVDILIVLIVLVILTLDFVSFSLLGDNYCWNVHL